MHAGIGIDFVTPPIQKIHPEASRLIKRELGIAHRSVDPGNLLIVLPVSKQAIYLSRNRKIGHCMVRSCISCMLRLSLGTSYSGIVLTEKNASAVVSCLGGSLLGRRYGEDVVK